MNEKMLDGERNMAGRTLLEMIAEARGYVELFLEDLENEETVIEEPQEMLSHIMATLEYAGRVGRDKNSRPGSAWLLVE